VDVRGHLNEEELIAHYYGDGEEDGGAAHLASCAACTAELESLKRTLGMIEAWPVPERGPGYGRQVWQRLAWRDPAMAAPPWWRRWAGGPRLALAGVFAALLVGAFLVGRASRRVEPPTQAAADPALVRQRILAAALSDHLEESERILLEILNREARRRVDIGDEQQRAQELLDDNRLYRQTAAREGHLALTSVLEDLERVLLDVARGPRDLSAEELQIVRARIDDQGLVFKVRVLEQRLRDLEAGRLSGTGRAGTSKG
jgi:hypothetical protein